MTEDNLARLKELASRFTESDKTGLHLRWEFGREVLLRRVGKKLPKAELAHISEQTGVARREIQYCLKFALRYPAKADCERAITQYGSWSKLTHQGLYNKKPKADPTPVLGGNRRVERLLEQLADLNPEDVPDRQDFCRRLEQHLKRFSEAACHNEAA